MSALPLRDYQRTAIDRVYDAWASGTQRPAIVLPTGSGKTVVFSHLTAEVLDTEEACGRDARVLILVHRDELVRQTVDKLHQIGLDGHVGVVKAGENDVDARVIVGSVQTLARQRRREQLPPVTHVIVDECFPAGTLIDGRPIESLRPGDSVPSWNERTGCVEYRRVNHVMSRTPESVVRVNMRDGTSIVCTPNHPILTTSGWCPAGSLLSDASVVSFTHDANAFPGKRPLHLVRGSRHAADRVEVPAGPVPQVGTRLLLERVPGRLDLAELLGTHGTDKPQVRLAANEGAQPYARPGSPRQDDRDAQGGRSQAEPASRQWARSDRATAEVGGLVGVADGGRDRPEGRRDAVPLPGRYRASGYENRGGGGRGVALLAGAPSLRPSQGRSPHFTRVAGVQVLERGRDGTYGGLCPDGLVYNIEVDTTHTYLIGDGVVAHNCHHAAAKSYRDVLTHVGAFETDPRKHVALAVGVTATLARSDGRGLGGVWDEVVYSKSILSMVEAGHLVDMRAYSVGLDELDLGGVKRSSGDYTAGDLGRALTEADMPAAVARAYGKYVPDRQGIVFTPTVATARDAADALDNAGFRTEVITGDTPAEDRHAIYRRYRDRETQVLASCMVLTEGFDMPQASAAVIARPTQSNPLYIQMVGRVSRPFPGKTDAIVLDLLGNESNKLQTLVDLSDVSPKEGESLLEAAEREEEEANAEREERTYRARRSAKEKDLFGSSTSAWLVTRAGLYFIPHRGGCTFIRPQSNDHGLWCTAVYDDKAKRLEVRRRGLSMDMAMAWAESDATELDSTVANRTAAWRRKKPSDKQVDAAQRCRIDTEGLSAGELSDRMSILFTSRAIDRFAPEGDMMSENLTPAEEADRA